MRGYKCGMLLMALSCWASIAVAAPAASGVAAPAAVAIPSPEEDYQAAINADNRGDMMEAGRLYLRAAERGHAAAQADFAIGLRNASMHKSAFEFFRKSAEQGNTLGMRGLAAMYAESGVAVVAQDLAEARKWYTRAADAGDTNAIYVMADAYINGTLGLGEAERDSPEALSWIKRSADIDQPAAMQALADAYRAGKLGLVADPKQADEWVAKMNKVLGIVEKKKKKERVLAP